MKEKLEAVRELTDKLQDLKEGKDVKLSAEELLKLKEVYNSIYPAVVVNLGCPTCVKQYLFFLQAWYEREYPAYHKTAIAEQQSTQTAEPIKGTAKRKKGSNR